MTYPISDVTRRVVYSGSAGTGPYTFTFEVLTQGDIGVYKNSTLLTLTTDYTVTINADGTGSITLTSAATSSDTIAIFGNKGIQRSTDFVTGGDLFANSLNDELDAQTIFAQQNAEAIVRSIRAPQFDPTNLNMALDEASVRAGKLLGFDGSGQPTSPSTTMTQLDAAVSSFVNATGNNAASILYDPAGTGAQQTTVQTKLREIVSPEDFGAVGDGTADDTTALQTAITAAKAANLPIVGRNTYRITSTVSFKSCKVDFEHAIIVVDHAGIGVIIGGNHNSANNPKQYFGTINRISGTSSQTTPTVRAMGVKGQHIACENTDYFQVYADTDSSSDGQSSSSAYSTFVLKRAITLELTNNPTTDGSTTQWINENQFFLNRTGTLLVSGTYSHNNNQFWAGNFEASTNCIFDAGRSNTIWCARFESGPTFTFNYPAAYNRVVQTWTSSNSDWRTESTGATFVDNGYGNILVKQDSFDRETHIVGSNVLDLNVCLDTQVIYPDQVPSLAVVKALSGGAMIQTKLIPVYKNDIIGFYSTPVDTTTDSDYRCSIGFYDADKNGVTPVIGSDPSTDNYDSSVILTISGNRASLGTGRSAASLILITDDVAYVDIIVNASSGAQLANQYADGLFAFIRRTNYNYSVSFRNTEVDRSIYQGSPMPVTGVPTQGYAPLGFEAVKTDGTERYIVTRSVDTTLTTAEAASATVIEVDDATGVQIGDIVGVQNDDVYVTNWTTVAGVSGTTITLTAGVTGACAIGNRVVFMKWTTITY